MLTEEDKEYLKKKHQGGISNAKGSLYEDYFAVFQIASCIAKFESELENVAFQTQLEDTFVDDLLVVYPGVNVYHQLKNSKITWKSSTSQRTITSDFEKQIEICMGKKEQFALKLVHSSLENSAINNIPQSIIKFTTTEYFPFQEDLNRLILICNEFQNALNAISARGDRTETDELVDIATIFLGIWKACNNTRRIKLSELIKRAENLHHFNLVLFTSGTISDECRNILNNIEGLKYSTKGRMLYWSCGFMNGTHLWTDTIEQLIIRKVPTTLTELVELL